jgi:diacylglycerol kinase family enzyme
VSAAADTAHAIALPPSSEQQSQQQEQQQEQTHGDSMASSVDEAAAVRKPLLSPQPTEVASYSSVVAASSSSAPTVVAPAAEHVVVSIRNDDDPSAILLQSDSFAWNRSRVRAGQRVCLTRSALSFRDGDGRGGGKEHVVDVEDMVGVEEVSASEFIVHSYPRKRGCCSSNAKAGAEREHVATTLTLLPGAAAAAEAQRQDSEGGAAAGRLVHTWISTLRSLLAQPWLRSSASQDGLPLRPRRILFLINPASGAGHAARTLNENVLPLIRHSGVPFDVLVTTHAQHAFEVANKLDATALNAPTDLVCVSGDGLVHEVLNGLLRRPDWELVTRQVRLGHIGGGSGNGLASGVCAGAGEPISTQASAFLLAKGYSRPLDAFAVSQEGEPLRFGCLSMGYGMISDIDLESESMRYLGNARFTVSALGCMAKMKKYKADVLVVPEYDDDGGDGGHAGEEEERKQDYQSRTRRPQLRRCSSVENGCDACGHASVGGERSSVRKDGREALQRYIDQHAAAARGAGAAAAGDAAAAAAPSPAAAASVGDVDAFVGGHWRDASAAANNSGGYTLLWLMNTTHAASDMHVAPTAHYSDGCMELYSIASIPRASMLSLFLSMEGGTHTSHPHISCRRVRAVRFHPRDEKVSQLTIDGERLPYKPAEARVFRGIINLLAK